MAKSPIFRTDATPWNGSNDVFIWLIVGVITAVIGHNLTKGAKKSGL